MKIPIPVEPGDKFGNRHGIKGVISQILPDEAMPPPARRHPGRAGLQLCRLPRPLVFGPALEVAWGRVAQAEGQAVIAPPFGAPSAEELRLRLKAAGLPEDGQETLTLGKGGPACELPSTVGWMYWNRMVQRAEDKLGRLHTGKRGAGLR